MLPNAPQIANLPIVIEKKLQYRLHRDVGQGVTGESRRHVPWRPRKRQETSRRGRERGSLDRSSETASPATAPLAGDIITTSFVPSWRTYQHFELSAKISHATTMHEKRKIKYERSVHCVNGHESLSPPGRPGSRRRRARGPVSFVKKDE
ncbi:hypothetical protein EVAR_60097_1 [Eumeta japonica]|uniref:Uncharacterized protein n=1 Tax=Eumeta variegata TaxID=151549 RepID=A0A4C2A9P4_EUMVA|nr:hypothetical protein EVAR_60097_1 [Eumeta japonica]